MGGWFICCCNCGVGGWLSLGGSPLVYELQYGGLGCMGMLPLAGWVLCGGDCWWCGGDMVECIDG